MSGPATALPRFLCDEMLARLARWLRAAGYDAALPAPGAADCDLLAEALASRRWLLTRDRGLTRHRRAADAVVLLDGDGTEGQARSLSAQLPIDWTAAPLTRCLVCNVELRTAGPDELASLPDGVKARDVPITACPACRRVYWPGGHETRIRRTLARLASAGARPEDRHAKGRA
jgi:hypothetical protein